MAAISTSDVHVLVDEIPQWKRDLIERRRSNNQISTAASCCSSKVQQQTLNIAERQQLSSNSSSSGSTINNALPLSPPPHESTTSPPSSVQQPSPTTSCSKPPSIVAGSTAVLGTCNNKPTNNSISAVRKPTTTIMVQERTWLDPGGALNNMVAPPGGGGGGTPTRNGDSEEELQYGPGIVSKLKNRYLSLTLRESNTRSRPSILPMRKATSLENLLEDDAAKSPAAENLPASFERKMNGTSNGTKNRYRRAGVDMKRAHSVEAISGGDILDEVTVRQQKRKSMCEPNNNKEVVVPYRKSLESTLNEYRNPPPASKVIVNNIPTPRINKPKRIAPLMNEKEKPPADVVKQTKKYFEGRPESRTRTAQSTNSDVAAKIASFKHLIVQTKLSKMPIATKQMMSNTAATRQSSGNNKTWSEKKENKTLELNQDVIKQQRPKINSPDVAIVSPIPDVSRVTESFDKYDKNSSLSETTPDLLIHSSPVHNKPPSENGRDRIDSNSTNNSSQPLSPASACSSQESTEDFYQLRLTPDSTTTTIKTANSEAFNFSNKLINTANNHLPVLVNKEKTHPTSQQISPTEPLKLEINGSLNNTTVPKLHYEQLLKKSTSPTTTTTEVRSPSPNKSLTTREIEKNSINIAKSKVVTVVDSAGGVVAAAAKKTIVVEEQPVKSKVVVVVPVVVPKVVKKPVNAPTEQTTTTFDFTHRNEVPDYIRNDGTTRSTDMPKTKDSGIAVLPGHTEEFEIDLTSPPSPCDVTFVNDNILIEGRSSISKRSAPKLTTTQKKVRLQFVDSNPEIFEYPSEKSFLGEDRLDDVTSQTVGHTIPLLSGSSLANYQPKSALASDDFQLGVTKTAVTNIPKAEETAEDKTAETFNEIQEPILFSAGTNSDILF